MKKFSLNRDIKRQISGVSFYLGGGEGEREGERKKRTCLPLTTPPLLARILAVICAKLRGCIFSSAFWDCIPRIASNFWGPSPPPWLAILSTTMVCVHIHARAYTHTYIYPCSNERCSHVDFLKRNERTEAFSPPVMDVVGWREMKWKEE